VRKIRLNMNRNGEVISLGTIRGVAQVSGTVRALMSGLLVSGVMVDFGSGWTATSGTNGAFGPVNVPNGDYMVRMTKGGFSNTLAYVTNLVAGATNVALQIEGGEKSVYGQIYNMQGRPVTNATVEVVEEGGKKGAGKGEVMTASGAGYYDLGMAQGERTYRVSSPDYDSVEVELDVESHTKKDIVLVPEPAAGAAGLLCVCALMRLRVSRRGILPRGTRRGTSCW